MRIDHATLDKAIKHYAANLGRPVWLDPLWLDLQHDAWELMINQHKGTPGKLIVDDFAEAIRRLLNGTSAGQSPNGVPVPPKPAQGIVPPMIVDTAVGIAAARHEQIRLRVDQADEFWLIVENCRLHDRCERARELDSVEAMHAAVSEALDQYQNEAAQVRADLVNSAFADDVINAKLAIINTQQAEMVALVQQDPPLFIDPADRPALPSLDEIRDLERVWREENE